MVLICVKAQSNQYHVYGVWSSGLRGLDAQLCSCEVGRLLI